MVANGTPSECSWGEAVCALADGQAGDPVAARAHVAACPSCRELFDFVGRLNREVAATAAVSPPLWDRLLPSLPTASWYVRLASWCLPPNLELAPAALLALALMLAVSSLSVWESLPQGWPSWLGGVDRLG
ncbi:MAG: hypothetical protein HY814_02365 [Candidatus Riflebacteria bacterium]|nr:hypothetical protein [Candidatus Riflebacteria bacterium]